MNCPKNLHFTNDWKENMFQIIQNREDVEYLEQNFYSKKCWLEIGQKYFDQAVFKGIFSQIGIHENYVNIGKLFIIWPIDEFLANNTFDYLDVVDADNYEIKAKYIEYYSGDSVLFADYILRIFCNLPIYIGKPCVLKEYYDPKFYKEIDLANVNILIRDENHCPVGFHESYYFKKYGPFNIGHESIFANNNFAEYNKIVVDHMVSRILSGEFNLETK